MNVEDMRALVKKLPGVTEEMKWGNDLCFCVGGKIFCMTGFGTPTVVCVKVNDDEFDELLERDGFSKAPYVGRYKWVVIENVDKISKKELEHFIRQSYEMKRAKLPLKLRKKLEKRD